MKENNKVIGERIFEIIKLLNVTVEDFAEKLGTTKFRLYSYKAGKAEAPPKLLEEMEEKLEINSKYVRKGDLPIFLNDINKTVKQNDVQIVKLESSSERRIPIYLMSVSAGVPNPIEDYVDTYMNVDKLFTDTTFIAQVIGDSMIDAGIKGGDRLLVDTKRQYKEGDIVIASVDHGLTLKRIKKINGFVLLYPENQNYEPIKVDENTRILGVVDLIMRKPL